MADYNHNYNGDRGGDFASWIPTLIMLFCFPPAGVVMLVLKLMGLVGSQRPAPAVTPMTSSGSRARPRAWAGLHPRPERKNPPSPKPAPASPGAGRAGA